jgi:DNA polymerase-3 subunit gamma/tau
MVRHLEKIGKQENLKAEADALHIIAQKADGALRDALSLFDRIAASSEGNITYQGVIENLNILDYEYYFRFTDALLLENLPQVMLIFDEIYRNGFEGDLFINGLAEHFRNLLVCKEEAMLNLLEVSESLKERYRNQAAASPSSFILTALNLCNECDVSYKMARQKRLHVEMTLMKICFINRAIKVAAGSLLPGNGAAEPSDVEKKKSDISTPSETKQEAIPPPDSVSDVVEPDIPVSEESVNAPAQSIDEIEYEPDPETDLFEDFSNEQEYVPDSASIEPVSDIPQPPAESAFIPSKIKPALRTPSAGSLPKLKTLDSIHAEVEEAEANGKALWKEAKLNLEDLKAAWVAYMESSDKESVKTMLKSTDIILEKDKVVATVGSSLVESTIRQESGLMEFLRKQLHAPRLSLEIKLDPTRSNAMPAPPKRLTDSEKYWRMKTVNPLVDEVRKRFDLHLDEE